jgi:hypothetical protein
LQLEVNAYVVLKADTGIHDSFKTVLLKTVLHVGGCRKTIWVKLVTAGGRGAWNYELSGYHGKRILESVQAVGCLSCKGTVG